MGPKGKHPSTGDLFQQPLADLINLKHPLVKLAELIRAGPRNSDRRISDSLAQPQAA